MCAPRLWHMMWQRERSVRSAAAAPVSSVFPLDGERTQKCDARDTLPSPPYGQDVPTSILELSLLIQQLRTPPKTINDFTRRDANTRCHILCLGARKEIFVWEIYNVRTNGIRTYLGFANTLLENVPFVCRRRWIIWLKIAFPGWNSKGFTNPLVGTHQKLWDCFEIAKSFKTCFEIVLKIVSKYKNTKSELTWESRES